MLNFSSSRLFEQFLMVSTVYSLRVRAWSPVWLCITRLLASLQAHFAGSHACRLESQEACHWREHAVDCMVGCLPAGGAGVRTLTSSPMGQGVV